MFWFLISAFLVGSSQAISNGIVAEDGQFPYSVAFLNENDLIDTGAVLISDQYVLSSSLFFKAGFNKSVKIALGTNNLYHKTQGRVDMIANISNIILPDDVEHNDIALLKLPEPIEFSEFIQPVQLPSWAQVNDTFDDVDNIILGYGANGSSNKGHGENILRYGNTTTLSSSECSAKKVSIFSNQICESSDNKVQICLGDYGGPMLIKDTNGNMTLIGVASATVGLQCGSTSPVIYTRITNYLQFIANNTNVIIRDS